VPAHSLGEASIDYLAKIRGHVQVLADEAGLVRTEGFARSWHILMKGSGWLIEHHRTETAPE
jgi:hypothetical protein